MNQSDGKPVCNKCLAFIALEKRVHPRGVKREERNLLSAKISAEA